MRIKKIFNNNILLAQYDDLSEVVLMGRGVAFQKKVGDCVDELKIEKKFIQDSHENVSQFVKLFNEIPIRYVDLTDNIVNMAEKELGVQLSDSIYIGLTDHINYSMARQKEGINLKNVLLWEVKRFYPKEFKAALKALDIIEYYEGIRFSEDEAGYIALHFVNAQQNGEEMNRTMIITTMVQDIIQIINLHYGTNLDNNSLSFHRLVTHLRHFLYRLLSDDLIGNEDDGLYEYVKGMYPQAYTCAYKIKEYFNKKSLTPLTNEEMTYLMMHINRVTSSK